LQPSPITSERRNSYRLPLEPGQARVKLAGGATIDLVDLSASGGSLRVPHVAGRLSLPDLPPLEIQLGGETVRTSLDLVGVRAHAPGVYHLGARWRALGADGVRKLSRFIAHEFQRRASRPERLLDEGRGLRVKSPLYIRNLLGVKGQADERPVMSVVERGLPRGDGQRLGPQLRVHGVTFESGQRVIHARFVGGETEPMLAANQPYDFVLGGSSAVTVFQSHCLAQNGREVTLTLPAEVRQTSWRRARRVELGRDGGPVPEVTFSHPRLSGVLSQPVSNVTARGLSFPVEAHGHGLVPGDALADLRIRVAGGDVRARGVVRGIARRHNRETASCGVELEQFESPQHAKAWRRFVFRTMHPNLIDGGQHAAASWGVLDASKYVALWTPPEARAQVRAEYLRAWQRPSHEVGHSLILYRDGAPVGLSAASLAYPRSWIFHHLGRDARHDDGEDAHLPLRQVLELISGVFHRVEMETDFQHLLVYFERDKRMNERLYLDFVRNYSGRENNQISAMEVFRRATDTPLPANDEGDDPTVSVLPATPALLAQLSAHIAAHVSPLEREAMALSPAELELGQFSTFARERQHERTRSIFFACENGEARAALIAESGSEGVNIFGLLNTCRMFTLGATVPSPAVKRALLRQATLHYRGLGKGHFLYYGESAGDGPVDALPGALGFEHVSGGLCWLAHRDVVPAWLAYLEGVLASSTSSSAPARGSAQVAAAPAAPTPAVQQ
jgi:hypothetical protein